MLHKVLFRCYGNLHIYITAKKYDFPPSPENSIDYYIFESFVFLYKKLRKIVTFSTVIQDGGFGNWIIHLYLIYFCAEQVFHMEIKL